MNYALSKRNLLLQVLYAFTRFYLYYQDELQMEKCLMEYTLTSLFNILLFPQWAFLVENCLGYIVGLVLRRKKKKDEKLCYREMSDTSEPFYCLDFKCKAFLTQLKYLESLAIYWSQIANQFFFLEKTKLKVIMFIIDKTHINRFLLVFSRELHTINVHTHMYKQI